MLRACNRRAAVVLSESAPVHTQTGQEALGPARMLPWALSRAPIPKQRAWMVRAPARENERHTD